MCRYQISKMKVSLQARKKRAKMKGESQRNWRPQISRIICSFCHFFAIYSFGWQTLKMCKFSVLFLPRWFPSLQPFSFVSGISSFFHPLQWGKSEENHRKRQRKEVLQMTSLPILSHVVQSVLLRAAFFPLHNTYICTGWIITVKQSYNATSYIRILCILMTKLDFNNNWRSQYRLRL